MKENFIDRDREILTKALKESYLYNENLLWKAASPCTLRRLADYHYDRAIRHADFIKRQCSKNLQIDLPIENRYELDSAINKFYGQARECAKYINKLNRYELLGQKKGSDLYRWHPEYDKRKRARYKGLDIQ